MKAPTKRVKLNAARRDSGIGYSSEEISPSQSPLPTNEFKFKLPDSTKSTFEKVLHGVIYTTIRTNNGR